jgi:flagellar biosynthesis chaperone FliJ
LTEQELDQIAGSYDRLLRKLQEKYELTMDQAEYELAEFLSTLNPAT